MPSLTLRRALLACCTLLVTGCSPSGPAPATPANPPLTPVAAPDAPAHGPGHPAPSPVASTVPTRTSFARDVVPVLRRHCIGCHAPGGPVTEHSWWFDAEGQPIYASISSHADQMITMIEAGEMPQGKPGTVTDEELATLKAWARAGAPDS